MEKKPFTANNTNARWEGRLRKSQWKTVTEFPICLLHPQSYVTCVCVCVFKWMCVCVCLCVEGRRWGATEELFYSKAQNLYWEKLPDLSLTEKVNEKLSSEMLPDLIMEFLAPLTQSVDRIALEESSQQTLGFWAEKLWHAQLGSATKHHKWSISCTIFNTQSKQGRSYPDESSTRQVTSLIHCYDSLHFTFDADWYKIKLTNTKRQDSRQHVKHARLSSDRLQAKRTEPFVTLDL